MCGAEEFLFQPEEAYSEGTDKVEDPPNPPMEGEDSVRFLSKKVKNEEQRIKNLLQENFRKLI